jgi:hypothetical protein
MSREVKPTITMTSQQTVDRQQLSFGMWRAFAFRMDRACLWKNSGAREDGANDVELRVLRNKLINLMLDWELEALSLDAQRYRAIRPEDRENLRESALAYRKCITKLTELLNSSSVLACKSI